MIKGLKHHDHFPIFFADQLILNSNRTITWHTYKTLSRSSTKGRVAKWFPLVTEAIMSSNVSSDLYNYNWLNDNVWDLLDRKSTRLNSSHSQISYAVFC